jgi:hypothetical protein
MFQDRLSRATHNVYLQGDHFFQTKSRDLREHNFDNYTVPKAMDDFIVNNEM